MERKNNISIHIHKVSKKFCRDIRHNLMYSFKDVLKKQIGLPLSTHKLRNKEFWALKDISFDLKSGEITAIVGMNGSGKTTLSRIISGIFQADEGEIIKNEALKITPIFTLSSGVHPLFTGRENIFVKGAAFGLSKEEFEEKVEEIIAFSEVGEFIDSPVGSYSSGMKSRLAYSIAIATNPDVLVIDEALAVGDTVFRAKCFDHIQQFVQQENKSVIYVTNHIHKVLRIANRVLVLDKGKLVNDTYDVKEGLLFYIKNCFKGQSPKRKEGFIKLIENWNINE